MSDVLLYCSCCVVSCCLFSFVGCVCTSHFMHRVLNLCVHDCVYCPCVVVDIVLFVVECVLCLYGFFMCLVFNMYLICCFRILVVVDVLLCDVVFVVLLRLHVVYCVYYEPALSLYYSWGVVSCRFFVCVLCVIRLFVWCV